MLKYIKRNQLKLSFLFTFFVLGLVLFAQDEEQVFSNWFRKAVLKISFPVHRFADFTSDGIKNWFSDYVWLRNVLEENQHLKVQIATLQAEQDRYLEVASSYKRIAKLLDFETENSDQKILAEIVAEFQQGYSRLIVVNKGAQDGVKNNFGVVVPTGVVGKVVLVNSDQSVVRLVTDVRSRFPVQIQATREKALFYGGLQLSIQLVDQNAELQAGMRVVTSGLAGVFPKGTMVGHVQAVENKETSLFKTATISPAVDFNDLEEVFIILKSSKNEQPTLFTENLNR